MSRNEIKSLPIYSTLVSDPDMSELVEMFVDEMPERIQTCIDLLNGSDWEGLRRFAHQLKGAAGSYGFQEISPSASVVEEKARDGQSEEEIRDAVETLCDMCRSVRAGKPE